MRLSLCNEVIRDMPFEAQCDYAARLGYDGLEIAPFTLTDDPVRLDAAELKRLRAALAGAGIACTGLHWLLVAPAGLSITSAEPGVTARTRAHIERLCAIAGELGARVLVHGSPHQRRLPAGGEADARQRAIDLLEHAAEAAGRAGVLYCLEPLARRETNFANTVDEAVAVVNTIASPHLRTMIDCSAAGATEAEPVPALIRRWMPSGLIAHVQVNDPNRRGPGQGEMQFGPILAALRETGYDG
ncbi:MAG: sugar phosphate isomerase/epimerase, partial [Burkholderiales bacterium]